LIKDQATRKTILESECRGGLYPLPESNKEALSAVKPSATLWHSRLGHLAFPIIQRVISENKLPCSSESRKESVCDAYQQAKSHQISYPTSSSVSRVPLELVHSDVWGPTPDSVGRKKYYVSFIDDFSKFTWIYLLKYKSKVFEKFQEFQTLVERQFDQKILAMQTD
jgi:hypothetical protein